MTGYPAGPDGPRDPSARGREAAAWGLTALLYAALTAVGLLVDTAPEPQHDRYQAVEVTRVEPPEPDPKPAPEPEPAPQPAPKPEPKQEPKPAPKPEPKPTPQQEPVDLTDKASADEPPPTESSPEAEPEARPVFGLGKASFGEDGSFQMRRGNTVGMRPEDSDPLAEEEAIPELQPVANYQVSQLPKILERPRPRYPAKLRSAGIEGDVILEVVVDPEGNVAEAAVVESADPGFEEAALAAIRRTRFEPAYRGETPVAVKIRVPVRFRLR